MKLYNNIYKTIHYKEYCFIKLDTNICYVKTCILKISLYICSGGLNIKKPGRNYLACKFKKAQEP